MNESPKPIKRSEALIQFSREHHFGLLLGWKIRQGLKGNIELERIKNYTLFFFENELKEHFNIEEIELFAKLAADDPLRKQAYEEHEQIYKLIKELENNTITDLMLSEFADKLDAHIRFEERILFNHLQKMLSQAQLEKLEETHKKREFDLDNSWKDHFWVKEK